ncbi:hypothetical protein LQW54_011760 [Pestalotiopsis sp. IQ-011]
MRFFSTLAFPVFFAAAVLAAPAVDKRQQPFVPDQAKLNLTDEILFKIKLSNFTARRDAKDPPWADWGSDGCSLAPDTLFKLSFKRACERRDFGYRNYKTQGRFDQLQRKLIDENFAKDLHDQCNIFMIFSPICNELANLYYTGARVFGGPPTIY